MLRQVLLATTNPAKQARLRWVVEGLRCTTLVPEDLPSAVQLEVSEDADSFPANAMQKARAWSCATGGMVTLASDGGLIIPALGDRWNALRTKRNAGAGASNHDRVLHLLAVMQHLQGEQRHAIWQEAIAVAHGSAEDGVTEIATWEAEGDGGLIISEPPERCDDAFWTECIRYYPAIGKRYCEFAPEEVEGMDQVWPRLRRATRAYLRERCGI